MTNEAVIIELLGGDGNKGEVVRYDCADNTTISKGTLCILSDAHLVGIETAGTPPSYCAGIAATDKEAGDGQTTIGVYTQGFFDLIASGAITAGQAICLAGAVGTNYVSGAAAGALQGSQVIGYACETAADEEVIKCKVKL